MAGEEEDEEDERAGGRRVGVDVFVVAELLDAKLLLPMVEDEPMVVRWTDMLCWRGSLGGTAGGGKLSLFRLGVGVSVTALGNWSVGWVVGVARPLLGVALPVPFAGGK